MVLKFGKLDNETVSFPQLSASSFTSSSGIFDRVLEGLSRSIFCDPRISTSSSTQVAVWGEVSINLTGGAGSWVSVVGLAAFLEVFSISCAVVSATMVSGLGDGGLLIGRSLAAAGSRRVALALYGKSFKRSCFQKVRGDKVKRSKEFFVLTQCSPGSPQAVGPRFHLMKLIKRGT